MGNPITLVEQFANSLGSFSGVAPIRFSNGAWFEAAGINKSRNPTASANLSQTFVGGGGSHGTLTRETTGLPAGIATAFKFVSANAVSQETVGIYALHSGLAGPQGYPFQMVVWGSGTVSVDYQVWVNGYGALRRNLESVVLTGTPQPINRVVHTQPGDTSNDASIVLSTVSQAALTVYFALSQMEEGKEYHSSFIDNTLGAGYGGSDGTFTRAASSASRSPSITPNSGAVAGRWTPTIETGVEEIWGECGVKGSGTDHVRWGRDATRHPFIEWSSNDASYQRLTASETINALAATDLALNWTGLTASLSVEAGTIQSAARDAVSGSWGAGNLTLEATAGGVIVSPFATFSRPLSAKEIATLNSKQNWTRSTLGDSGMAAFQLRPVGA
jgi:hypothetical protein